MTAPAVLREVTAAERSRPQGTHAIHRQRRSALRESWRLPSRLGVLAATAVPHEFVPLDASQCLECFGWRDDFRHLLAPRARR